MDEIIKKYADRLQAIYDNRTAGDYSFNGVLAELLEEIDQSCGMMEILSHRHRSMVHDNYNVGGL